MNSFHAFDVIVLTEVYRKVKFNFKIKAFATKKTRKLF